MHQPVLIVQPIALLPELRPPDRPAGIAEAGGPSEGHAYHIAKGSLAVEWLEASFTGFHHCGRGLENRPSDFELKFEPFTQLRDMKEAHSCPYCSPARILVSRSEP